MVCESKTSREQSQRYGSSFASIKSHCYSLHQGSMMSDDKPFACKVPGCNQKFVNEDHLEVHRKKHDANLGIINLKSLDTPVIADQTPTPTRFLKVLAGDDGLFSDLQGGDLHSNPFEAEFRKASKLSSPQTPVDTVLSDESHLDMAPSLPIDDSKHTMTLPLEDTPQSSLSVEDSHPTTIQLTEGMVVDSKDIKLEDAMLIAKTQEETVVGGISMAQPQATTTTAIVVVPTQARDITGTQFQQTLSTQIGPIAGLPLDGGRLVIKLPNGQTIPVIPPSVTNPQAPIPTAVSANPNKEQETSKGSAQGKPSPNNAVKQKLKTTLLSNQTQGNMNVMTQAVDVVTRQQEAPSMFDMNGESFSDSFKRKSEEDDDDDSDNKRQKFLERNRAAAMRCRNKRKQWINDLEKRADDLTSTNSTLSNEVSRLRNEVAQLKELLLAHKDCPVTIQQREAGLFTRVGEIPQRSSQEATVVLINNS